MTTVEIYEKMLIEKDRDLDNKNIALKAQEQVIELLKQKNNKIMEWMDINLSTQSKLGASDEVIRQLLSVRAFVENYPSLHFTNPELQARFERVNKDTKSKIGWNDIELEWSESDQVNSTQDYVFKWLAENYNPPIKKIV